MKPFRKIWVGLLAPFLLGSTAPVWAHSPGQAMMTLHVTESGLTGKISVYYGDLPPVIDGLPFQVPSEGSDLFTDTESKLLQFLNDHIRITTDGKKIHRSGLFRPPLVIDNQNNAVLSIRLEEQTDRPLRSLTILQSGFYPTNPRFTTVVHITENDATRSVILSKDNSRAELIFDAWTEARSFVRHGVTHILSGLDHIFFILLLIFSPFLSTTTGKTDDTWRAPLWTLIKLATAFTVAHSLTLCLAVLKLFWMSAGLVDILVIFSIVFVGLHNLVRFNIRREWLIVFAFGLFHGYGFSSALQNAGLSKGHLWLPLAAFNVGVEIGQVMIIAVVFAPLYLAARRWPQTGKTVRWSTALITLIAGLWLLEKLAGR